ncbi:SDR family NAD(P)-dependent oxidoreductase [uncultured Enterovirga sp.]|uniref:SDR family NAD(P)-dependent oxidoreductase n=1 Tax=uncultured Enterovirga sp. TaxID=2026352 RepID=UPI0035CBC627
MRLAGKTGLVTGGANGIGAAIVRRFREEGANVVLVDRASPSEALLATLGPGRILPLTCDVTKPDEVSAACDAALAEFGRVDILVNNAGGSGSVLAPTIEETTDEIWAGVLDLNLTSILRFSRTLLPAMKAAGWGRIINMSSRSRRGVPIDFPTMKSHLGYVVAKGAMVSMTIQFSRELGPYGITCNAIAPGLVLPDPEARITRIFRAQPEEWQRQHIAKIPVGRPGDGGDIAGLAAYLAAPESSYVTGQTIDINGGGA